MMENLCKLPTGTLPRISFAEGLALRSYASPHHPPTFLTRPARFAPQSAATDENSMIPQVCFHSCRSTRIDIRAGSRRDALITAGVESCAQVMGRILSLAGMSRLVHRSIADFICMMTCLQ